MCVCVNAHACSCVCVLKKNAGLHPSVPLCACLSETEAVSYIDRTPAAAVTTMSVCRGELHKYILESELILNFGITQGMISLGQSVYLSIHASICSSGVTSVFKNVCWMINERMYIYNFVHRNCQQ